MKEMAPREWQGTTILLGEAVAVKAHLCREVEGARRVIFSDKLDIQRKLRRVQEGLDYWIVGKIDHFPNGLVNYVGIGRMDVTFPEFKIKCLLQDKEGNIESCSRPMPLDEFNDTWSAKELWLMSGGNL